MPGLVHHTRDSTTSASPPVTSAGGRPARALTSQSPASGPNGASPTAAPHAASTQSEVETVARLSAFRMTGDLRGRTVQPERPRVVEPVEASPPFYGDPGNDADSRQRLSHRPDVELDVEQEPNGIGPSSPSGMPRRPHRGAPTCPAERGETALAGLAALEAHGVAGRLRQHAGELRGYRRLPSQVFGRKVGVDLPRVKCVARASLPSLRLRRSAARRARAARATRACMQQRRRRS